MRAMGRTAIISLLNRELPYLRIKYGVRRVGLFGSFARGMQRRGSDMDLLVEFEEPVGFFKFIELEGYLRRKLGARVDLVTKDALKRLIKPRVMREVVYA